MGTLTKQQILSSDDIKIEEIDMRRFGWPGTVHVCGLTGSAHSAWERSLVRYDKGKAKPTLDNARAKLLVRCIVNEQRQPIFEETDIERLSTKSCEAISHLYDVARRLSGLREEDAEELTKNSVPNQDDEPTSG
jgi:hypothetical protein